MNLILASASPRRRELLALLDLPFRVITAGIDETPQPGEAPVPYTLRLAEAKAHAILRLHPESTVIGADTTVTIGGELLGKPRDAADATRMLQLLRNRTHQVTTGVAVLTATATLTAAETTHVTMANISDAAIAAYIATGEPMDKAGAYAIQGRAARWIPHIAGDYTNVVGLPIARLHTLLQEIASGPI